MSKINLQDYIIFQLVYRGVYERKIKILGYAFVEKNKDKCKIIYNEKEYELTEYFYVKNHNHEFEIEIQLKINNSITNIKQMFKDCETLLYVRDISNLNNYNNLNESFDESCSYNYIDESNNVSEEKDEENNNFYNDSITISSIHNNSIISELRGMNKLIDNLDIQPKKIFNNIIYIHSIFEGCSSLISIPDLSKWDTKYVINMKSLFNGCSSLILLPDLSKWDTKYANNMDSMFNGCSSLISLPDLSKWNTKINIITGYIKMEY